MLSYISDSVARALGREPSDLIDRPFTDLISAETADGGATSERTLGFYLSSHVAFQDLIVRAKTKNEIWWSISGRPVHDEIGRFFGFRGFASDLTKMRQSEVELDRLARQDFADRPRQPRSPAPGARRRAGQRGAPEAPLLGVPARPRPLQGGQRHARPSGGRHLASAGVAAAARRKSATWARSAGLAATNSRSCCPPRLEAEICRSSRRASSTACRGPTRSTAPSCRSARRWHRHVGL